MYLEGFSLNCTHKHVIVGKARYMHKASHTQPNILKNDLTLHNQGL